MAYNKKDYKEQQKEKVDELLKQLEEGVKEVFGSDNYKSYLETMSKFHNYSFSNCMLIEQQKPSATLVAGYGAWKKKFERNVKKGEKGIKILAPMTFNNTIKMDKLDPKTEKPIIDSSTGKNVQEEQTVSYVRFKTVNVFDVSQTDGKDLPTLTKELTGDKENADNFINAIKKVSKVPIGFENIENGSKGYYSPGENKIAIKEGMSSIQTIKTAIHELAHSRLHNPLDTKNIKEVSDRKTKEVEAESVAFVVSSHFGINTSDYSFPYIAAWSSDKDVKELKQSLATIQKEASKIIGEMEEHLKALELNKDKEVDVNTVGTKEEILKDSIVNQSVYAKVHTQDFKNDLYNIFKDRPLLAMDTIKNIIGKDYGINKKDNVILESSYYLKELSNKNMEVEDFSKATKDHIEKHNEIDRKVKVEISWCEQWTDTSMFNTGDVYSFKEANKLFEKYEKEIRNEKVEAEKKDEYVGYNKCRMCIHAEIDGKQKVANVRYDIGDGYAKNLLDFMKKEYREQKDLISVLENEDTAKVSLKDRVKEVEKIKASKSQTVSKDKKVKETIR